MKLVEQHLIRKSDPRFAVIDQAAFAAKNLYNQANYQIHQHFFAEGTYLPYTAIFHRLKHHDAYCALPRKVSNSILIQLQTNWVAFFRANEAYKEDPSKFLGRPKIPGYKDKEKGRHILIYDKQALGKRAFKKTGKLIHSGLPIEIETKITWGAIDQVRIVLRLDGYMVEVVYQRAEEQAAVDRKLVAAIDLGVNVLAAVTSTKQGFQPLLINGRPLKSFNQHYNKQRARHQSRLAKARRFTSRQLDRITTKRNRRIDAYLHTASRRIITLLVSEGIGTLVVGKNPYWKQEESYTSKASFLDRDTIPAYDPKRTEKPRFRGKREKRGLYRASDGRRINADMNGSYNILRKAFSDSFGQEIGGQQLPLDGLLSKRR